MKTVKRKVGKITQVAPFFCVCGCKRLVLSLKKEHDGPVAVAQCYKCDIELEHASDIASLKRKLMLE